MKFVYKSIARNHFSENELAGIRHYEETTWLLLSPVTEISEFFLPFAKLPPFFYSYLLEV
jgi:hypothetical protein